MTLPIILADDFLCTNTEPITDIHIWASYVNDTQPTTNAIYTLSIWSDVPAGTGGTNYSQPGIKLWTEAFTNGQYQVRRWNSNAVERFWNPDLGPTSIFPMDTNIWQYNFYPTNPFIQYGTPAAPITYWLSVTVRQAAPGTVGWKTSTNHWNDDAVFGHTDGSGNFIGIWQDLRDPTNPAVSLDLSFALTTPPPCCPETNGVKTVQEPDTEGGFNLLDSGDTMLASQFVCTNTGMITDIHYWGSWSNDVVDANYAVWFGIYTNSPSGQPGALLWQQTFGPGQYQICPAGSNNTAFINPFGNIIAAFDTQEYYYCFYPTNPFVQQGTVSAPATYWLASHALNVNNYFGWTSATNYCYILCAGLSNNCCPNTSWATWSGGPATNANSWFPTINPATGGSLPLAFKLTTSTNEIPPPPTNTVADKWLQIPDVSTNGLDVRVTDPKVLADDFRCNATGPITQVRIWTSWRFDQLPPVQPCFSLGLWSDVPADTNNNTFSHPGSQICGWQFPPGAYTNFLYTNNVFEQFFDPTLPGSIIGSDTMIWEYVFTIPTNQLCWQTNGNVYWLSVSADCFDANNFMFGWKTCPTNWNDDAVFGDAPFGAPPSFWQELRRPPFYTNSLDLAFEVITTQTNTPPPPTNNIADKWLQIPDASTNGIDVRATDPSVLADDFLCTATGPITQIRVWGSWLNDLVDPNVCFCLSLWSDNPSDGINHSQPSNVVCRAIFCPGDYTSFIYSQGTVERFWDPSIPGTNGFIGTDTQIWEYVFNLPTNSCWYQTNGNIYWLAVDCFNISVPNALFGWKTCPTNWNDDAVYGFSPTPCAGEVFVNELRRPGTTNSLDLAFEIITSSNNPCPPVGLTNCPPDVTVQKCQPWVFGPPPTIVTNCCTNYTMNFSATTNAVSVCQEIVTGTWTVVDCHGNTASCSQTVVAQDTVPPVVNCPTNKTAACGSSWSFDTPTAVDLCCGTNVTINVVSTMTNGTCPINITRTWLVTDCCTNSVNCAQTVTLIDTNPPAITCPTNILVLTCSTNIQVTWSIMATDSCSSVTVTSTPPSGTFFNRDTTNTVTAIATDACGNTNSCSFQVVVRKPTLTIAIGGTPGTVTISWADGGILQDASSVLGPWTDLPLAASPYTITASGTQAFYRLRCP